MDAPEGTLQRLEEVQNFYKKKSSNTFYISLQLNGTENAMMESSSAEEDDEEKKREVKKPSGLP